MAETELVRSLFVTLRRGMAGKPWFHRRVIDALGLNRRHECIEKPNNASIRGMLMKVPHLVAVETDKMHYYRRLKDYYDDLPRPPLSVSHAPPSGPPLPKRVTTFVQALHTEHVAPEGVGSGFSAEWTPKRPIQYLRDEAAKQRVAALQQGGLYSQKVKRLNEEHIAHRREETERKRAPPRESTPPASKR